MRFFYTVLHLPSEGFAIDKARLRPMGKKYAQIHTPSASVVEAGREWYTVDVHEYGCEPGPSTARPVRSAWLSTAPMKTFTKQAAQIL